MGIEARADVAAQDDWSEAATLIGVAFDRLDVTVRQGHALMQFSYGARWVPVGGILIRNGLSYTRPGLTLVYPPRGPDGVRFKRATAGSPSTLDVELASVE